MNKTTKAVIMITLILIAATVSIIIYYSHMPPKGETEEPATEPGNTSSSEGSTNEGTSSTNASTPQSPSSINFPNPQTQQIQLQPQNPTLPLWIFLAIC